MDLYSKCTDPHPIPSAKPMPGLDSSSRDLQRPVAAVPTCAEPMALGVNSPKEVVLTPEPNPKRILLSTPTPVQNATKLDHGFAMFQICIVWYFAFTYVIYNWLDLVTSLTGTIWGIVVFFHVFFLFWVPKVPPRDNPGSETVGSRDEEVEYVGRAA